MTEMLRNVYIDKLGKILDEKHNAYLTKHS